MRARRWSVVLASLSLVLGVWAGVAAADGAEALVGRWTGSIRGPGIELGCSVAFTRRGEALAGTIDIPAQGAKGLALERIQVTGSRVRFAIAGVPGEPTFDGALEGERLAGTFTQGGARLGFALTRGEAEAKSSRPQDPAPPFPYEVEDVEVRSGPVVLAGTITRPRGEGPFPAVVLISGSGPQNRDEELMGHRPFAVLADALTRAGVLVLRHDDRGVGASTGTFAGSLPSDFADDAEACVRLLAAREDVSVVGLLGHSEGGMVAPMVAARNEDVAFLVLLAAPGQIGRDVLVEQNRAISRLAGLGEEEVEEVALRARQLFDAVLAGAEEADLLARLRALATAQRAGRPLPPEVAAALEQELDRLRDPWFGAILAHDPRVALRMVRVPVLALYGELDCQVSATKDRAALEEALREAENPDVTVRALPGLNHLFQPCTTGAVHEYAQIETTIDPAVLDQIGAWILERPAR